MKGFLTAAIVLIGLDVALNAPGSRIAGLVALPASWLAKWMSPDVPLIPVGQLATAAAAPGSSGGPGLAQQVLLPTLLGPIGPAVGAVTGGLPGFP